MSDQELRDAGPAGLAPARHSSLRAALLTEIHAEQGTTHVPAGSDAKVSAISEGRSRDRVGPGNPVGAASGSPRHQGQRRGTRRTVGVAVATLCIVATATAAAAAVVSILRPDPHESAKVIDKAAEQVQWHNEGWRPELQAELVNCISGPTGTVPEFEAYAADFPLTDAIDARDYLRACETKAAEFGDDSDSPSVCAADSAGLVPRPTVLLDGSGCGASGLKSMSDSDVSTLNAARTAEVSLLAFPQNCPTVEQATSWVSGKLGDLAIPLALARPTTNASSTTTTTTPSGGTPCYRGFVDWDSSTVTIEAYSMPG